MKPVPVPCGTSSDWPPWPNGTAACVVTCTVAGRTLSTTPERLGSASDEDDEEGAATFAGALLADSFEEDVDDAEGAVEVPRAGLLLEPPPQATRSTESTSGMRYFMAITSIR